MQEAYRKAIQKIKEQKEILTEKQWNAIAKEENLLSAESIKYISGKELLELQKEVRAS